MASMSFKNFVEQRLGKIAHFVIYAFLEWMMIFLLFTDGLLAFIAKEFAKIFELRYPCLLCTRIDHVLISKGSNFYYNDSICEAHKKDISSLAYCHVHRKLSAIRAMCEGCLLSYATGKDYDLDTYKSLVGILHKDINCFVEDDHRISLKPMKIKDDMAQFEHGTVESCACCGVPMRVRASTKSIARNLSMGGNNHSQTPAPSPRTRGALRIEDGRNLDLPHIRYTELKFMSDADLEHPEDETGLNGNNHSFREDKAAAAPLLQDSEDITEDIRTPTFNKGNKFFGIPLSDSVAASPRWSNRNQRKNFLDKLDMAIEPNENHATHEGEGESILHRLKKQVHLDHKSLISLYMELDEERSASAVAANNAMAMITRLQAEKAAVQMEALQYQRMMEEQAEYDQEALQIMKDLLTKREEEIKVLEADLDVYREKYGDVKKIGSEECEVDGEDYQEWKSQSTSSHSEKSDIHSEMDHNERYLEHSEERGGGTLDGSSLDFEDEKSYLLGMLTNLEKKINVSSDKVTEPMEADIVQQEDDNKGENKASLTREVSIIRERLRAIEADSGFLKHAAMILQRNEGGDGTKLLTEIAQHLSELRQSAKVEDKDA